MTRPGLWRAWLLPLVLLLAGCTWVIQPPATPAQSPPPPAPASTTVTTPVAATPATVTSNLDHALALTPDTTKHLHFTDWAELQHLSGTNVTSADSLDDRLAFIMPLARDAHAIATFYGRDVFLYHAETWGWDATDLLWEAYIDSNGPPVWILRFRKDFDFAPVLAHLEARQFPAVTMRARRSFTTILTFPRRGSVPAS